MPQKKKLSTIVLTMSTLLVLSFIIFKLFPVFQSKAEGEAELVDFHLSSTSVNTYDGAEGEQSVTVWARLKAPVTEPVTEITAAYVTIIPPSEFEKSKSIEAVMTLQVGDCVGITIDTEGITGCGTSSDGIYMAEIVFPVPSVQGAWTVNFRFDYGVDQTLDIPNGHILGSPTITNSTTTEDTTPPEIIAWEFEVDEPSNEINTADNDVEIVMFARLRDDLSGISSSNPTLTLQGIDATESDTYYKIDFALELVSDALVCSGLGIEFTEGIVECGNEMDGIYMATTILPRYSPKGTWKLGIIPIDDPNEEYDYGSVGSISLTDRVYPFGNSLQLSSESTVDISFFNHALIEDINPPEIVSLTMTPSTFNTNLGPQDITITMEVEDDLSGVKKANISIRPLISTSQGIFEEIELGTVITEGEIIFTITIPQGSKTGLWVVEGLGIEDNIGNGYGEWGFKNLSFAFPDLELFLVNQAMTDEVLIEEDWYIEEWDDYVPGFYLTHPLMSIKFQEGTVVSKKEGGSFAFHRMLTRKYDMSQYKDITAFLLEINQQLNNDLKECHVSEGCFDSQVNSNNLVGQPINILKMGIPGLNLSFSKPVIISLAVDDKYLGTTFVIQTFNHSTEQWTNETTCLVKTVEPASYEHGGGPDGFFKPGPYTACQFEVNHATFFSTNILGESTTGAGVPNTGVGGLFNYLRRWIR